MGHDEAGTVLRSDHMSGDVATARVDVFAARRDDMTRLDPVDGPAASGWPCVDSTEWAGGLDRLVAEISGRDMGEFSDHELVFPDRAAGDWEDPWLVRVPEDVVIALSLCDRDDIARYADRVDLGEEQAARAIALWEMCRRARGEQADLYQWSTA
jgi:hypothetical protein